ncbi:MAG: methionyl-tRNA formyltransferase [Frondihabitans sp.]|nr:methionyl-tRNA formyltransferase [Frondihabitans sp.]
MRLVFAGSPAAAVPSLRALAGSSHDVVAVLTRDDTPQGRKRTLTPTPVAAAADELGLPVIKTRRITEEVTAAIAATEADLGVIVAYGALLREPLLSTPRLGWINLHFSLLPRWRGAAPVQRALIAGDASTGAMVFQLVAELDAGVVHGTLLRDLDGDETAGFLLDELSQTGAALLSGVVDSLAAGTSEPMAQTGEVTLAPKLTLDDGLLDFTQSADVVVNRYRGVTPEPGAFSEIGGVRLKILDLRRADRVGTSADTFPDLTATGAKPVRTAGAASGQAEPPLAPGRVVLAGRRVLVGTATDAVELVAVQPAGKKLMPAADWIRGVPDRESLRFDEVTS